MSDIKLTYDGVTTYYNYQGDKLLSQYNQNDDGSIDEVIFFLYDGDDNIIGMNYEGNFYYYQKNVLSDVIAVYDANGVCVAEYEYDAWGNVIYQSGGQNKNLAIDYINPIRYRSYYYENSVGMYYLQSRYYYATAGRFINADDPQIALDSKEDTDGTNLFAYCCNDPVNNIDPNGFARKKYTVAEAKKKIKALFKKYLKFVKKYILSSYIDFQIARNRVSNVCSNLNTIASILTLVAGGATIISAVTAVCSALTAGASATIAAAAGVLAGAATIAAGYVSLVSARLSAHNKGCNLTLRLYTKVPKKGTFKVYKRWFHA